MNPLKKKKIKSFLLMQATVLFSVWLWLFYADFLNAFALHYISRPCPIDEIAMLVDCPHTNVFADAAASMADAYPRSSSGLLNKQLYDTFWTYSGYFLDMPYMQYPPLILLILFWYVCVNLVLWVIMTLGRVFAKLNKQAPARQNRMGKSIA